MKNYQLQDVKAHLSEFVHKVAESGPLAITVHGKQKAILMPVDAYEKLNPRKKESLLEFFRRSPLRGSKPKIERDKSPMRKVEL